jgi:hypothetical protein
MAATSQLLIVRWSTFNRSIDIFKFDPVKPPSFDTGVKYGDPVRVNTDTWDNFDNQNFLISYPDVIFDYENNEMAFACGMGLGGGLFLKYGRIAEYGISLSTQDWMIMQMPGFLPRTIIYENATMAICQKALNIAFPHVSNNSESVWLKRRTTDMTNPWKDIQIKTTERELNGGGIVFARLVCPSPANANFSTVYCLSSRGDSKFINIDSIDYKYFGELSKNPDIQWQRLYYSYGALADDPPDLSRRPGPMSVAFTFDKVENKWRMYFFFLTQFVNDHNIYYHHITVRSDGSVPPPSAAEQDSKAADSSVPKREKVYSAKPSAIGSAIHPVNADLSSAIHVKEYQNRLWVFWSEHGTGSFCSASIENDGGLGEWKHYPGFPIPGHQPDCQFIPVIATPGFID